MPNKGLSEVIRESVVVLDDIFNAIVLPTGNFLRSTRIWSLLRRKFKIPDDQAEADGIKDMNSDIHRSRIFGNRLDSRGLDRLAFLHFQAFVLKTRLSAD
ncbi:hypothetical protein [Cohaesibacter gelatinilyticus]|uniref:hypothetical protein n=1 Tax=Cohaesibacter gelatinilyticus TaxID=372072 RepID=UPI000BE45DA5|nr:hypothetical protein [Cohaesibacter gelatinilyticus]HAT87777.1 hypothetical protein [Hyphomicrobiales bacterium]